MTHRSTVRAVSAAAATALLGASFAFVAPAAQAAPVFLDSDTVAEATSEVSLDSGACTQSSLVPGPVVSAPVVENGPATTFSSSSSGSWFATGDVADTVQGSAQVNGSASVRSANGSVTSIDVSAAVTTTVTTARATSLCEIDAEAVSEVTFAFSVTQPGFLDVATAGSGAVTNQLFIVDVGSSDNSYITFGNGFKFTNDGSVFLPAGNYVGVVVTGLEGTDATTTVRRSGAASVHAEFDVAGSQTEAVAGKGRTYVSLPTARSCATDSVDTAITSKGKRAKKISIVKFFVNNSLVKKAKTPKKAKVYALPVLDTVDADVRVEVTLLPRKPGKPAKVKTVTASYEACS